MKSRIFILTFLLFSYVKAFAINYEFERIKYELNTSDFTAEVTGRNMWNESTKQPDLSLTDLVIPEIVNYEGNRYKVIGIADNAFTNDPFLRSIILPQNVYRIGNNAFALCSSLESCQINGDLESVGEYAFHYDTSIKSLTFPGKLGKIGCYAFASCESLESIEFKGAVACIDKCAFYNSAIKKFCAESLKEIRNNVFFKCKNLETVELPNGIEKYGDFIFRECVSLKYINLPYDMKEIPYSMFLDCTSLEKVILPSSVKKINYGAFENCTSLSFVYIPDGVELVGMSAFEGCTSLSTVFIDGSVELIWYNAFANCGIKHFAIRQWVSKIDNNAFADTELQNATLYVNRYVLSTAQYTSPYNQFGSIQVFDDFINGIENATIERTSKACYDITGKVANITTKGFRICNGKKTLISK